VAYISSNYKNNPDAPVGKWTCASTSKLKPFDKEPSGADTKGLDLCGQCVSYVKRVCPSLPATMFWRKGAQVKGSQTILAGTVIATFSAEGKYQGHAAIYVSQSPAGITVYDQYVTPPKPKAIGERVLSFGAHGNSNNGDNFYIVD